MAFDISNWLEEIKNKILEHFGNRVLFIGFQGSYKRGEATDSSDIDVVVILDKLGIEDLKSYRQIVKSMPFTEKACGFISGEREIKNWSKSDIFQFYFETEALFGCLQDIITPPSRRDIEQTIRIGVQNLYHAACHSFVFDEDIQQSIASFYKMSFFVLQAKYYLANGVYIATKKQLLPLLSGTDRKVLEICLEGADSNPEESFLCLLDWCRQNL